MRVKEVCKRKNITLAGLSEKINVSPSSLSQIIKGNPTLEKIQDIARGLNCEVHELIKTSDKYSHFYDDKTGEWLGIRKK